MAEDDEDKQPKEEEEEEEEKGESKKKRRKRKRKRKKAEEEEAEKETAEIPTEEREDDTPRTVFVEGVPYDATPEQVAECFVTNCKEIDRSSMVELRFPTWQDTGRLKGYGHVVFSSKDQLEQLLKVVSHTKLWMGRRYLNVQRAKPKTNSSQTQTAQQLSAPSKTILIKQLDYQATEENILEVMEQFGSVVEGGVRIARNFSTRQSKGFAYIEFEDMASSRKAVERAQKKPLVILKRACLLDYDEGRIKGSFKTATGRLWSREYKQPQGEATANNPKKARAS